METIKAGMWETLHDLTQEQVDTYKSDVSKMNEWRNKLDKHYNRRSPNMLIASNSLRGLPSLDTSSMPNVSRIYWSMSRGYVCPYCNGYVHNGRNCGKSFDLFSKKTFEAWMTKDISDWPQEKKSLFVRGKKEVEEYFTEVETLESKLEQLRKEENQIIGELTEIWSLCDTALKKDIEREAQEARTERMIRKLRGIPSSDDVYYPD